VSSDRRLQVDGPPAYGPDMDYRNEPSRICQDPGTQADPPRLGRPRSARSKQAILAAAYEGLAELGFQALSMDEVARRAGASKATLYRWWHSKAEVVLDAVAEHSAGYPRFAHTADTRADLRDELRGVITFYNSPGGRAMLDLIAHSRFDPTLADELRDRFIQGRRRDTAAVLVDGIERGQLRADLNLDATMDAIWGAVYYKLLVSHTPPAPGYADEVLATLWPALAVRS
jgi:AcrR family transcriptional regulator